MVRRSCLVAGLVCIVFGLLSLSLFSSFNFLGSSESSWGDLDVMIHAMLESGKNFSDDIACNTTNSDTMDSTCSTVSTEEKIRSVSLPQHDQSSLTSYMWLNGKPFHPLLDKRPSERPPLMIDAVSIGSKFSLKQMEGQAVSWGSHWSMRYLFGTTEQDDADPHCHSNLTDQQFERIFPHCQTRVYYKNNRLKAMRLQFPRKKWIEKGKKTKGWLCAQQRFAHAIGKVGRFYRKEGVANLPDFFFIQDDDTWFGMNKLLAHFASRNQFRPYTAAGCVIQWPAHIVNFSFPFGGFGVMMNRHSVERLIKPIYCNTTSTDPHTTKVCFRLQENLVGETMAFEDGMSISDLMDRHAAMLPYVNYEQWGDPGYCMLGDWVIGHYVNNYELGSQESKDQIYVHTDESLGYIYKKPGGNCRNHNARFCRTSKGKHTCHRMKPDEMREMDAYDAKLPFEYNASSIGF